MDAGGEREVRFPTVGGVAEVRGVVRPPAANRAAGGLLIAHGRSNDMNNRLVRRIARAGAESGLWTLRFNFRYVDAKRTASRALSEEEGDLRGAVRFARTVVPSQPLFVGGKSMGARVCARASADPDIGGVVALGYPLHPRFRPRGTDPPEWSMLVKPAVFVQGDHDPFCDLTRLREELPKLPRPHELVVIRDAGHSFEPIGRKRDTFPDVRDGVLRWISRQADLAIAPERGG